jgi:hypothetical protein
MTSPSFVARFKGIGSTFGGLSLDSNGLPRFGSTWRDQGRVVRYRSSAEGAEVTVTNPHPLGRLPKRVRSGIQGEAELVTAATTEIKLRSKTSDDEIIVVLEY